MFHGKHYTNYGVASAAVRLINVILNDANAELPVSNWNEKYQTYLSYPAVVGNNGVVQQLKLNLTDEEEQQLAQSANYIKTRFDDVYAKLTAND